MSLKKTLDALNLRRVVVDEKTGACEVSFAWTPRAFSPMGALWGTVQLAWGFALVHYIFYGLFAAIFIYAYGRHDWRVLAACVTVIAAYTPSFLDGSEFRLGRPWDALRTHPIWALSQAYFPARLVRTTPPIDPNKKYVFGWHPHGILILSRIHVYGGVWETLFPGVDIRVLGASPMFKAPGCREICLWMGAVDAGRRTAERVLKAGKSVVVYPGGSREIFDTDPNSSETRCHLTKRKGFVRLALKHGAELVPVFVFGEKKCYRRLNVPVWLRDWLLRRLKIRSSCSGAGGSLGTRCRQSRRLCLALPLNRRCCRRGNSSRRRIRWTSCTRGTPPRWLSCTRRTRKRRGTDRRRR